jgi:hypothetical protein
VIHLAAERALNQRLLQSHGRGVDGLGRHRAVAELLKQLGGNRRQLYRWGLGFARHIFSWGASYALNTKLLTDPLKKLHAARATELYERKLQQFVRVPVLIIDGFALKPVRVPPGRRLL